MRSLLTLLLSLLIASSASAVTMEWTFVGNPGNPADAQVMNDGTTGYGSVPYAYYIGTYEVTNAQYIEFLNAKAASDPLELYNESMSSGSGGITRTGGSGSYVYSPISGRENMPVNFVSFYDVLRFANWMNNGQGAASTETGAYTLLGGTPYPSNGNTVTRNPDASIALTSEDEWYKAAFYDPSTTSYFDYSGGSNTQATCSTPTATANRANCGGAVGVLTPVGSYTGSASPYGTFDQGGNVVEWNETSMSRGGLPAGSDRGDRGGSYFSGPSSLAASFRGGDYSPIGGDGGGFRLAMIPEPGTGLLVIAGLLGLAGWRRVSA